MATLQEGFRALLDVQGAIAMLTAQEMTLLGKLTDGGAQPTSGLDRMIYKARELLRALEKLNEMVKEEESI